jgi:hypothetical protein
LAFTATAARIASTQVPLTIACIDILSALWDAISSPTTTILPVLDLGEIDAVTFARLAAEGFTPRV